MENLNSRSPSPQRTVRSKSPVRSRSVSPEKTYSSYGPRSTSPEKTCPQHPYRNSNSPEKIIIARPYFKRASSQERPVASQLLKTRSPSPLRYSPVTKTFSRSDSDKIVNGFAKSRSPSPLDTPAFKRSNSYEPDSGTPTGSYWFKRSFSFTPKENLPSNLLRSRSASPHRFIPASSYFQKSNEDKDRNSSPVSSRSVLSQKYSLNNIPEYSYSKLLRPYYSGSNKYNTLPSYKYRRPSPNRDTFIGALFDNNLTDSKKVEVNYFSYPTKKYENKNFLPNSITNLPPLKMTTSKRFYDDFYNKISLGQEFC